MMPDPTWPDPISVNERLPNIGKRLSVWVLTWHSNLQSGEWCKTLAFRTNAEEPMQFETKEFRPPATYWLPMPPAPVEEKHDD